MPPDEHTHAYPVNEHLLACSDSPGQQDNFLHSSFTPHLRLFNHRYLAACLFAVCVRAFARSGGLCVAPSLYCKFY